MSFILIFLGYFFFRIRGVTHGNTETSELAFDILACGACVLFPRLAFFSISNNVVILALQGMITEFLFFIFLAMICFSGLLFCLWELQVDGPDNHWTLKSIAWLMVQIWFGNTSLSFAQASSFHPLFGPILMVIYAAMANTLLITILISILSNTFARINASATQEYLFQFAISTLEGVKSDAYQPPFNLVAYTVLWLLSWVLTPRALHTVNVFMIRLTSIHVLLAIGIYERYFAFGGRLAESGKDAAQALYNSLPRQIKNVALIEAIVGSNSNDVLDAVFEVGAQEARIPFQTRASDDLPRSAGILSEASIERGRPREETNSLPQPPRQARSLSAGRPARIRRSDPPRLVIEQENGQTGALQSPLARIYSGGRSRSQAPSIREELGNDQTMALLKRMETVLDDIKERKMDKFKEDIQDLQERQARIESLLLTLTRASRA
jgi:hypothetical protein